jgi:hypothetical protein
MRADNPLNSVFSCVAVQPGLSFFGSVQAPFYVLKGY